MAALFADLKRSHTPAVVAGLFSASGSSSALFHIFGPGPNTKREPFDDPR